MWDVWIHILEIAAECACWGDGRPSVPPLRRRRGKPGRRVREAAPYKRGGGGKPPPYGFPETVLKLGRGALVLPPETCAREASGRVSVPAPTGIVGKNSGRTMCAPTREGAGTWPLIRPSVRTGAPSPQGEGLGKTKRDRSGTCLLKHGGEAELRRKFFWFLFFQEKELLTFFFKESRQLGKVLYEMQENFAEISTFLTGGTVAKAGRLW